LTTIPLARNVPWATWMPGATGSASTISMDAGSKDIWISKAYRSTTF
jgi:hypothetical protein